MHLSRRGVFPWSGGICRCVHRMVEIAVYQVYKRMIRDLTAIEGELFSVTVYFVVVGYQS